MRAILVMLVILLVIVVIFSVQNPGRVDVAFLVWDFRSPLLLVGLVFFGIGLISGIIGMAPYYLSRRREARRLRKDVAREHREAPEEVAPGEGALGSSGEPVRASTQPEATPPDTEGSGPPAR